MARYSSPAYTCATIALACVAVCAAWILVVTILLGVWNAQNLKTLNGVEPLNGNVDLTAGPGIAIVPDVATHTVDVDNTGVITINGLSPLDPAGNIIIAATAPGLTISSVGDTITLGNGGVTSAIAGTGISVSSATGDVTIGNTGVLSIAVSPGLAVNQSTGAISMANTGVVTINSLSPTLGDIIVAPGDGITVGSVGSTITVSDEISTSLTFADIDAMSPTVTYTIYIGSNTAIPTNTWQTGPSPGFPNPFFPGSAETGYGDVGGVAWVVPIGTVGMFQVTVNCELFPNTIAVDDLQTASVALCLGATSEDPFAAGIIPSGGYATATLAGGTNSGTPAPLPPQVSLSAVFQAGCVGCPVQAGNALTVHVRLDQTGTGLGPYTLSAVCYATVARLR